MTERETVLLVMSGVASAHCVLWPVWAAVRGWMDRRLARLWE